MKIKWNNVSQTSLMIIITENVLHHKKREKNNSNKCLGPFADPLNEDGVKDVICLTRASGDCYHWENLGKELMWKCLTIQWQGYDWKKKKLNKWTKNQAKFSKSQIPWLNLSLMYSGEYINTYYHPDRGGGLESVTGNCSELPGKVSAM